MFRTKDVDHGEVNGGARSRPAPPVEQGLAVEGGRPTQGVHPAEGGGEELEEQHGFPTLDFRCPRNSASGFARTMKALIMGNIRVCRRDAMQCKAMLIAHLTPQSRHQLHSFA